MAGPDFGAGGGFSELRAIAGALQASAEYKPPSRKVRLRGQHAQVFSAAALPLCRTVRVVTRRRLTSTDYVGRELPQLPTDVYRTRIMTGTAPVVRGPRGDVEVLGESLDRHQCCETAPAGCRAVYAKQMC